MNDIEYISKKIRAGIKGKILDEIDDKYCFDFGHYHYAKPLLIVQTTCEEDIKNVQHIAGEAGISVTIRGTGKSFGGQSLSRGGILIENFKPETKIKILDNDLVELNARCQWTDVELALNQAHRAAPVLTDHLNLSVGGTLSVGGIGVDSIVHGFQVDQIQKLRLIRPDGTALWCSPQENEDFFRFSLAGLGQVGLIEKVIMKTRPNQKYMYAYKSKHKTIKEQLDFIREISHEPNGIETYNGWIVPGHIGSEFGFYRKEKNVSAKAMRKKTFKTIKTKNIYDEKIHDDYRLFLNEHREQWLKYFPEHVRFWSDYIFDFEGMSAFMNFLEHHLKKLPFSRTLQTVYMLIIRRPDQKTNFALLPAPQGKILYSVGLYNMVSLWQPTLKAETIKMLKTTLQKCKELGGRPYLYGFYDMDETLKRDFYKDDYEWLVKTRNEMNFNLFNPDSF